MRRTGGNGAAAAGVLNAGRGKDGGGGLVGRQGVWSGHGTGRGFLLHCLVVTGLKGRRGDAALLHWWALSTDIFWPTNIMFLITEFILRFSFFLHCFLDSGVHWI